MTGPTRDGRQGGGVWCLFPFPLTKFQVFCPALFLFLSFSLLCPAFAVSPSSISFSFAFSTLSFFFFSRTFLIFYHSRVMRIQVARKDPHASHAAQSVPTPTPAPARRIFHLHPTQERKGDHIGNRRFMAWLDVYLSTVVVCIMPSR